MLKSFILSKNLKGRFAVVKLWPNIKAAEDECIARLKNTATALGLECIEIYEDGRFVANPSQMLVRNDVDFVIHLHYDTPKLYDAFSFVALWNPIHLYHQWGYARCSRNLISHDDFVSCSSDPADAHLRRLIRNSSTHLPPFFNLYHSVSDSIFSPSLGDQKLFYAGINWEVLNGGASRHQDLLKLLDQSDILRIYGPEIFQGVRVWEGYKSYVHEIPFDGVSMMKEISRAGISLVLSSEMHKQSELMSNRLFESIAAGAVVICDENNFAKKFFGNTLLYIDTRDEVEKIGAAIFNHLSWIRENPELALKMVGEAQELFRKKFSLKRNLQDLYEGLLERKSKLAEMLYPAKIEKIKINVNFLMPEYFDAVLESHLVNINSQEYPNFSATLVIDKGSYARNRQRLESAISKSSVPIKILGVDYYHESLNNKNRKQRNLGEVILQALNHLSKEDEAVVFVAPNEKIFSNHLNVLAGALARNPTVACAASAVIFEHPSGLLQGNQEIIDFRQLDLTGPIGYGRFIFRTSMLAKDLEIALPYLHKKAMAALIDTNQLLQEIPATVLIETKIHFPSDIWDEGQENELLSSHCPSVFKVFSGFEIKMPILQIQTKPGEIQKRPRHIKWVAAQVRALRKEGISARMRALKVKFKASEQS